MGTLLLNKPYGVLCRFTDPAGRPTLADYVPAGDAYPAGRLDQDSEGLVVLTSEGWLQARITDPQSHWPKTYWAQVEGTPSPAALQRLREGVRLNDGMTRPAGAEPMDEPLGLWARHPPVRFRQAIPTQWLALTLTEGRNRQVRRMTAAVGHPTLRLIRWSVGPWSLGSLRPGEWRELTAAEAARANRPQRRR